jgi:hypothetical protein
LVGLRDGRLLLMGVTNAWEIAAHTAWARNVGWNHVEGQRRQATSCGSPHLRQVPKHRTRIGEAEQFLITLNCQGFSER